MMRKIVFAVAILTAAPAFAQTATSPAVKQPAPITAPTPVKQSATALSSAQIDINTASAEQLGATKGLGKSYAEAIVKGRPYKSADELLKNKILPETVYEQVKHQLTVRQN